MNNDLIVPQLPFVWPWPVPNPSAGTACPVTHEHFERAVREAKSVFGVVSAIDDRAINWMEGFLADSEETQLRLVISLHPTCRTSESVLQNLVWLVERHHPRAAFRVYPEASLLDRSSNLLCLCGTDGSLAIANGPTENLGFVPASPSHANLVTQVTVTTFEACRKWFDYLWHMAGELQPELATFMPRLILPEGEVEAAHRWEAFRELCLKQDTTDAAAIRAVVDPESGEEVLVNQDGNPLASPTQEIGVPKLDPLAESIARLFELGLLVTIEKLSRIPPLEAPVKPEWFDIDSFQQTGMLSSHTSIKVVPFDEKTLKNLERLRRISGELLPKFSFSLTDGMRWIPKNAIPLYEAALAAANEEAKKLLGTAIGDNIDTFLQSQRARIKGDAQSMYQVFHPGIEIPGRAVDCILAELGTRLNKTKTNKIIPVVAYSPIAFNPASSSEWSSPWGQVFTLLKGIAEFPRKVSADPSFLRGITVDNDALIQAMTVAGPLLLEAGGRNSKQFAKLELELIKLVGELPVESQAKCRAIWALITSGRRDEMEALLNR